MRITTELFFAGCIVILLIVLIILWGLLMRAIRINNASKENQLFLEKRAAVGFATILQRAGKEKMENLSWIYPYYNTNEKLWLFSSVLVKSLGLLHGNKTEAIREFSSNIGFTEIVNKKMASSDWYENVMAIRLSHELGLRQNLDIITSFSSHPHISVRQEVQIALVVFLGWESLDVLALNEHPISHWQQIRIIKKLEKSHPVPNTTPLQRAILTSNPQILALLIRIIANFKITEYKDFIITQLESKDLKTVNLALKILPMFESNSFDVWIKLCQINKDNMLDKNPVLSTIS